MIVGICLFVLAACGSSNPYDKPGFRTEVTKDGRLWILADGQKKSHKHVTLVGEGPDGMTIKAPDSDTAWVYLATKKGFKVKMLEERLWIFRDGEDMKPAAKHIPLVGEGPGGITLRANDRATLDAWFKAAN